ncbi:tRNA lysidine(34) synthetase TilS [Sedimentitalea sp. CY04]|uniref:tRNA(Ile)-lysidine synthase n=1 Tax=Parasedimentitalea denitrificans TaxID=2211118 RepID=A0ABX0W709_9RHOB|nr:tRNA lysidine(34) synthetase TilS [Sedimentitalea sp. CY04]NIZ61419.1 tRNA lysidine(34) synthetase TilS [Sedimentitalea sp. CY04]
MNILSEVQGHFRGALPSRVGVALSGGGDSVALLHVLATWFQSRGVDVLAATVDHGLRDGSAQEAQQIAEMAAGLGVDHEILRWDDWDGKGNLQDQARRARYQLLGEWAKRRQIPIVALGHTADDQAETVLMRLARSAGVDGLAAMPVRRDLNGITLLRPLLKVTRAQLRSYLTENNLTWVEDPSNQDRRFERVRLRQAMQDLEPLGLTIETLSTVAENMARAKEALDHSVLSSARELATTVHGAVVFDEAMLRVQPDEVIHRLILGALRWVSGAGYPLRRQIMREALDTVRTGGGLTLGGCRILSRRGQVWICREYNAVRDDVAQPDGLWDNRWRLEGGADQDLEVRPLGKNGLSFCPDWRDSGCPREVLEATPSLWRGQDLIAAPMAEMANGWTIKAVISDEEFYAGLLSH